MEKVDEQSSFQSTKVLDDINETHEEYSNPFKCLISKEQGNTIQYLCNDVYDSVFKFNKITESEKNELSVLLNDYCNDKVFISFINKLFCEHNSAYDFKSIIQMAAEFPKISTSSAQSVLNDVFKATDNLNIKHYILFLTISVERVYKESSEKFAKLNLYNGLFYQYFMQYIDIYIKESIITNSINIHNKFCLLSFICQYDEDKSSIPGKIQYFNVAIDYSKCDNFKDIWKQIVTNYDALSPSKTQGFNLNGSFVNSVKIFTYIAPTWDNLSATFALRNKTLPLVQNGMSGGNSVSDSDVVKIFAGDYTLVPNNQPLAKSVNVDVISNFDTFNQLSNNRKLQTSHFLIANRKRFNDILSEATQIVVNGLKFKLDDSNIVAAFENNQYIPIHAKNIGINDKNDMLDDSLTFIKKLKYSFDSTDVKTYDQAINFIVHSYIPLLNQFENRCVHKYGIFESKSILSKYATDKVLNVIGISSLIDTSFNSSLMGGMSQSPKIIEKRIEVPVIKEVIKEVPVFKEYENVNNISYDQIEGGGTSSEDLIKALIEGQKQFNNTYEVLYRKLISALNAVTISEVQSHTFSKLYTVCNQFNSIAIKSNKTTSYISGYYGAKNYNRLYTLCVENAIKAITDANVPSFNDALEILKELKQLLKDTADNVQQLRIKFISAPKNISEMLIVASRDVKQPCALTQKDFNALNDAIARIYNTIRTYSSESNIYNTKQQLENYISKVEDRNKIINEHYDQLVMGIRTIFVTTIGGSKEVTYAKEAWISIINQRRDCMLYLNKVLDTKLTKERIEELKNVNLSQEQIDNIERAFLAFKNIQITPDFKNDMEKLSKLLNHASIGLLFKVIKKLKNLIIKSQYLNFIAQLYKELHIFNTDFNWSEFIDKISNLIVLSSISIDTQYLFNNERYTMTEFIHKISYEFEKFFLSIIRPTNEYPMLTNSAYNFMYDYLDNLIGTGIENTINNDLMISNLHDLVFPYVNYKSTFDEIISRLNANNTHQYFLHDYLENELKYSTTSTVFTDNIVYNNNICSISRSNHSLALRQIMYANNNIDNSRTDDFKPIQRMTMILSKLYEKYNEELTDVNKLQHAPYYIKHLPIYLLVLYRGSMDNVPGNFYNNIGGEIKTTDYFGVSVCKGDHELNIAKYAIDSLFANVLAVVDKYWAIKYNGNMGIPLNINMILRGGNKQEGGTIFDSMPLHDQSYSSVIPEAVPFYICAFNICQYYMTTFSDRSIDALEPKLILNVNKISILYPIYELFNKYRASIKTFTPTQMKTALSVFNEIWNQTKGNEAAKLSRSIDILFNELNACFIFTDKIQLEIIKTTNSLSKAAIDVINERIKTLVEKMKTTLDDSVIEFNENPETQAKRLELILNNAFNRVKNEPESQRLAALKSLLVNDDKDGNLRDFYKFMELVVSPMLISSKSYIQIFSLFNSYSFDADVTTDRLNETIDFKETLILYKDFQGDAKVYGACCNIWDVICFIKNKSRCDLKALLIEHPIVLKYNKMKLNKALDELHKTGRFIMPDFWIVMDENTYPRNPKETFSIESTYNMNDNIALMKQIWPTVEAKTVADYYNHCVSEFISDYDHFIHNFLSYPGLSDKTIKIISKAAHDALKIHKFSSYENDINEPNKTYVYKINQSNNEMFNNSLKLAKIRITKSNNYLYPPPLPINTLIPSFNDINRIEELEIVDESLSNGRENNVHIDGTGVYVKSQSAIKDNITGCEYTWVDWVIFHLARCDKTNFCIPYKLLQIIQDYPGLNIYIRQPGYERKSNKQLYNRLTNGAYNNVITQNIIARSSSTINSDKLEYSSLNSSWIGGLISVTPYLINTLIAYKSLMNQNASYNGNSVLPAMSNLIDALTIFYDDLSNYVPFIPFMSDSVQNSNSYIKTHTFAELLSFITNHSINNIDSTELIKIEWANRWFFTGIDNISFPDYKNKDRFEWIKTFAEDKINNNVFKTEFDTTIQTLGRNVWAGLIAKTSNYNIQFKNMYRELDEIIIKIINIMCECDPDIVQNYINNVIHEYNIHINSGLSGKGLHMSGGNELNKTENYDIPKELEDFVSRLTKGFNIEPMTITKNNTVKTMMQDYNNVTAKSPFKKSKLYLFHLHVPKDVQYIINKLNNSEIATDQELSKINRNVRDILNSKSSSIVYESVAPLCKDYLSDIIAKTQNNNPNIANALNHIRKIINNNEIKFKQDIQLLGNILNRGMESELVNTLLKQCKMSQVDGRHDHVRVINTRAESTDLAGVLENMVHNLSVRFVDGTELQCIEFYRLLNNAKDGMEKNKAYLRKYLAYIFLILVGLKYSLCTYLNNIFVQITDNIFSYSNELREVMRYIHEQISTSFNFYWNTLNAIDYNDVDSYKSVIEFSSFIFTLPIFYEKSKNIYLLTLFYTRCENINIITNDISVTVNHDNDLGILLFYMSIVQIFIHYIHNIGFDESRRNEHTNNILNDITNDVNRNLNIIYTSKISDIPINESYLKYYINFLVYSTRSFYEEVIENNSITGGKYSDDKIKTILTLANTYAKCSYNRAIYVDVSQNINSFPLILDKSGTLAPVEVYLYKYLYNPNLCSLFNKTQFNNTQYVLNNISLNQLFIIDSFTYDSISYRDLINLNKVHKIISNDYLHIINNLVEDNSRTNEISPFYLSFMDNNNNKLSANNISKYMVYMSNILFESNYNNNYEPAVYMDINRNLIPRNEDFNIIVNSNLAKINDLNTKTLHPTPIPVKTNSFCKSVIKPKTHTITIDDKMFMHIPYSKALSQHLFSPRKDVYNATLISVDQIASPTILENYDNCLVYPRHIEKLNALNTYNSYIGNDPTYSKDLSNYNNFEINPIHTFIETLLDKNLNEVFNSNEAIKFNNFGFDIGSMSLMGKGILGGYNISETFSSRFVNINDSITGNNELEILSSAYNIDKSNSDDKSTADGKLLYSYIFKSDFDGGCINDSKKMFTLILNYFHKYNISFNSMFNQLCYPSILFNAAALRLSIDRLSKIVSKFNDYTTTNNSYKYKYFDMIKLYISNYSSNNKIVLDVCEDYRYQIKFNSEYRNPYMSIKDISKVLNINENNPGLPGFDKNKLLWLCNQYSCPSVANNFLIEFVKYITINTNEDQENNKTKNIQSLFVTGIPAMFRHLDSITSFINVLFMLLKQTSYYSHEYDRDMTFFNVSNPEPFSIT